MTASDEMYHARSIYIDVELSCWAAPPPTGMCPQIIEIGFVEMDMQTLEITRERSHFVRPRRWEISDRCTELTGITKDDIKGARSFPDVLEAVSEEFAPSKALCCTWGNDASLIASTCKAHGLKTPLRHVLDFAHFFQSLFLLKQTASLRGAVEMLDLRFDGVPHGALVDARNTALVHAAVIRRMRRQPDPPPPAVPQANEAAGISLFGEQLRKALGSCDQ